MGSLTSSDLIFPTDAIAWLGFTAHVYYLLEDSVSTRMMWAGPWRGAGRTAESRREAPLNPRGFHLPTPCVPGTPHLPTQVRHTPSRCSPRQLPGMLPASPAPDGVTMKRGAFLIYSGLVCGGLVTPPSISVTTNSFFTIIKMSL